MYPTEPLWTPRGLNVLSWPRMTCLIFPLFTWASSYPSLQLAISSASTHPQAFLLTGASCPNTPKSITASKKTAMNGKKAYTRGCKIPCRHNAQYRHPTVNMTTIAVTPGNYDSSPEVVCKDSEDPETSVQLFLRLPNRKFMSCSDSANCFP